MIAENLYYENIYCNANNTGVKLNIRRVYICMRFSAQWEVFHLF
jgi:hypothetical protein